MSGPRLVRRPSGSRDPESSPESATGIGLSEAEVDSIVRREDRSAGELSLSPNRIEREDDVDRGSVQDLHTDGAQVRAGRGRSRGRKWGPFS